MARKWGGVKGEAKYIPGFGGILGGFGGPNSEIIHSPSDGSNQAEIG